MAFARALLPVGPVLALALAGCPPLQASRAGVQPAADAGICIDTWCEHTVAPGVLWRNIQYSNLFGGPQAINVLQLDPAQVTLRPVQSTQVPGCTIQSCRRSGPGCYETVSSMAERTGALAGINGGFFCNGQDDICSRNLAPFWPSCSGYQGFSLLQVDGGAVSTNCKTARTTFGLDDAGAPHMQQVAAGRGWPGVPSAIGAGPNLVSPGPDGGTPNVTDEGFPWVDSPHPRTAVGLTGDGHLVLIAVNGHGMTLPDLASYLIQTLGVVQAMNFDGGGSTTMYVRPYGVVNQPSDGCERRVYDGLFVFARGGAGP